MIEMQKLKHSTRIASAIALVLGLGYPTLSSAELLRCKDATGKMIYTNNKALCPGAKPFEPRGSVQTPSSAGRSDPSAASRPSLGANPAARLQRARERRRAADAQAGEAARWLQKKQDAEKELARILEYRQELRGAVTWCNRGNVVYDRDSSGIKRTVSCDRIQAEYAGLEDDIQEARDYLENGLPDECRKAGCLPGWLR